MSSENRIQGNKIFQMQKFVLKGLFSTRRIRYKGFKGIRGVNLSKLGIRQEKKETLLGKFLGPSYNFK